jgi:class 3 adenylate cyclase
VNVAAAPGPRLIGKSLDAGEVRLLGHGTGTFVEFGNVAIGRAVLEPGWRWSRDIKPLVGTSSCRVHHLQLVVAGRFAVRMDDGDQQEFGPNTVVDIPPGHDTWVVGDEPAVLVDMAGNVADFALPASHARTVMTMLMTDIVDSTRMAGAMGDAAWKQRLGEHDRIVRHQLERFGGREIKTTGDGFLAAFGSAEGALRAALAIASATGGAGIEIRTGVHTGEVEALDGDLRGIAVHATARIMATAPGGTVRTSAVTRALAAGGGLLFTSTGSHDLKGFEEPMELFEVHESP